jgi:dTDP-4-dehydrorhamnose 3,5-epimerase
MKIQKLIIPEVVLFKPTIYKDKRGFFYESFNKNIFSELTGTDKNFVQDNHSKSSFGCLRGLHFQKDPFQQGKLIRVVRGEIFDVAVDIRKSSKTFGEYVSVKLSARNKNQLWVPEGFAHGFLVLSKNAEVVYKTTDFYNSSVECCIKWNDPTINIKWPFRNGIILSDKDQNGLSLKGF